jgi:hypothetical protein
MVYYTGDMSKDETTRPTFLDETEAGTLRKDTSVTYVDAFERQLRELYIIQNPALASSKEDALSSAAFSAYANSRQKDCTYVYFPWNRHLVKTCKAADYYELKTNRNRDLITAKEQGALKSFRVGVFGLSVGSNIAFVLTQAGVSDTILIADFDELDTTNLNRILAGVHQVGLNKAVIAARRIYEDNPFATVESLQEGVSPEKLEEMLSDKRLDCIVDEVDDMPFKIQARKLALRYKIPVVMVTDNGDGVVLHVERYDLGYGKIFGKDPAYFDDLLSGTMTKEKGGALIMNDIVGGPSRVDPRMLASVKRVLSHELVSWSQLGSAAILGGVVATYIIKKIALGESRDLDIRAYISPLSATIATHAS